MADDAAARDAEIRARLEAEAGRTKAVLRELARSARSTRVRAAARATLRGRAADDVSEAAIAPAPRLAPETIQRMREVARELANRPRPLGSTAD